MPQDPREHQPKISASHLERLACVYIRQSTLYQVEHNVESKRRQYNLVDHVVALGWPRDRVHVMDEDQGHSSSTPGTRAGFEKLARKVVTGQVGLVMSLEASRLARNSPDWHGLVYACRWSNTLIGDENGVFDPSNGPDRMMLGIRGAISELELDTSIRRMHQARWLKATRGQLARILPAGYDYDELGNIVVTADETVAQAIRQVFARFADLGTARQVYLWWKAQGLPFPVRRKELRGHPVVFVPVTISHIQRTLTQPTYAGVYAFGKSHGVRELEAEGPLRVRVRRRKRDTCPILIPNHHAGYISLDEHNAICARLKGNSRVSIQRSQGEQGAPREGRGLLQGLARCGQCGRGMYVTCGGRRPSWQLGTLTYVCRGEDAQGERAFCQSVGGKRIDEAVAAAFLEATGPAGVEVAAAVAARLQRQMEDQTRSWNLLIERAEYEAQRAQRQFNAVEPENRIVARELERRWNAQLAEVDAIRKQAQTAILQVKPLSDVEVQMSRHLSADLTQVWNAPTTMARDRKRLLRCVMDEVQLVTRENQHFVKMVWKGGAATEVVVPRLTAAQQMATSEDTVALVRRLALEFSDNQIMHILNKQKRRSATGKPFTQEAVRTIRRRHDIPPPGKLAAGDDKRGPFTADEAAGQLGVNMSTIHRWLRDGVLVGRQATPGAPWRIILTDEIRQRLRAGDAPPGWVSLSEAARRLGMSKQNVAHLVKTGKLPAVRATVRNRQCWRISVEPASSAPQPGLFDPMTNAEGEEA